jgi:hypothetical protein
MSIAVRHNRSRGAVMAKEIRARFSHGVLEPLEALDLKKKSGSLLPNDRKGKA